MNLPTQLRPRIDGPSDKYDVRPWTVVGINPDDLRAAGWVPMIEVAEARMHLVALFQQSFHWTTKETAREYLERVMPEALSDTEAST